MAKFESDFDVGETVVFGATSEVFVVRFVMFSIGGVAYRCFPKYSITGNMYTNDQFIFDEAELEQFKG